MFSANTFRDRRAALIQKQGSGLIFLPANNESPMNCKDNTYRYRQDSTFLYYAGLDQAGLALVLDADSGEVALFGDDISIDHMIWMGPQPALQSQAEAVGLDRVRPLRDLQELISKASTQGRLHFLPPYRHDLLLQISEWTGLAPHKVASAASKRLIRAVVAQRSIKSPEEIIEIEKAVKISGEMHAAAMRTARPDMLEAEVAANMRRIALAADSDVSFPIICSIHGEVLHNHHHHNRLATGRMLLCDAGAESGLHYAGDLTRTFPVAGSFTDQQKAVYQIVLDAQLEAISLLKPGIPYRDVHLAACRVLAQGLTGLGIMKGEPLAAVEAGAHALFLPHGLGHMMGLDVHDMENLGEDLVGYDDEINRSEQFGLSALRLGRRLEPGFVLTVEPGIYFIPGLIDKWKKEGIGTEFINFDELEKYRDFGGIRIEDDCLITEDGYRVFYHKAPKEVSEVEALRAEALATA